MAADRYEVSVRWLEEYAAADVGVEGLVAKGASQRYLPGQRGWVKLRIRNTREATIGAVIGPVDQVCASPRPKSQRRHRPTARPEDRITHRRG